MTFPKLLIPCIFLAFISLFLPGVMLPCGAQSSDRAGELYTQYQDQIVQIRVIELKSAKKSALGSGFSVSAKGQFATNFHVISEVVLDPKKFRLEYLDKKGTAHPLKVQAIDIIHDLAIVAADSVSLPFFELRQEPLYKGTRIYSVGNPFDLGMTIIEGTYNGLVENTLYDQILFSGSLNPGMSGGPAIDGQGKLLGVNVATTGNELSFLVPVSFLKVLLDSVTAPAFATPADFTSHITQQLLQNQDTLMSRLMTVEWKLDTLGHILIPREMSGILHCWGESEQDSSDAYSTTSVNCQSHENIELGSGLTTGKIEYDYQWYESKGMNKYRFYHLLQTHFKAIPRPNFGNKEDFTDPRSTTEFVTLAGQRWKVVMCVWGYKKYPGLNDISLKMVMVSRNRESLNVEIQLAGITKERALAFVNKFMGAIRWKN